MSNNHQRTNLAVAASSMTTTEHPTGHLAPIGPSIDEKVIYTSWESIQGHLSDLGLDPCILPRADYVK
jgi:hypothetical protein